MKGLETPISVLHFPFTQNGQRKEQLLHKQNQISLSFSSGFVLKNLITSLDSKTN